MVSKITKKISFKSVKECRSRRRKKSPTKKSNVAAATSVFIASINQSLFKIFSKLTRVASTGATPRPRKSAYQILSKLSDEAAPATPRRALDFSGRRSNHLPPLASPEKRTIVFDLDETLVHSSPDPPPEKFDFIVQPTIENEVVNFYVQKRPGVDELLAGLAGKFEVVVFTAGIAEYASLVLDRLDRTAAISHRLYRDSCKQVEGRLVKDLSSLGRDLRRVAIVDDNPNAYALQPENAIPVCPFTGDHRDGELRRLMEFLDGVDCFDDMRDAVKHFRLDGDGTVEI